MIQLFEIITKVVAYLFPILIGVGAYNYFHDLQYAILGLIGGAIISAIVFGLFLTIIEIYNTLQEILDLLDSKIGNEEN